jgi:hypothetical protein
MFPLFTPVMPLNDQVVSNVWAELNDWAPVKVSKLTAG